MEEVEEELNATTMKSNQGKILSNKSPTQQLPKTRCLSTEKSNNKMELISKPMLGLILINPNTHY